MVVLKTYLSTIPDPRRAQGRMYDLGHLLLFSILAVLSGATSYRKIQRFIHAHREQLNALCGLKWKRAPAHTSIRYALQGLKPAAVERAFRAHAAHLAQNAELDRSHIAFDGKPLRGSFDHFEDQQAVQLFSALATDTPLVLGQVLISDQAADKTHEIPAAQQLIDELNLSSQPLTLDALHTQKTVEIIRQTDNHALVQLKRNQPTLYERVLEQVLPQPVAEVHHTHELGQRNRIERRTVAV